MNHINRCKRLTVEKGEETPFPIKGMDSILCLNVRGLKSPNKQKEIKLICNNQSAGLIGLLENKVKSTRIERIAQSMFGGREYVTNLEDHYNGRIWMTWRPEFYQVNTKSVTEQAIHVK